MKRTILFTSAVLFGIALFSPDALCCGEGPGVTGCGVGYFWSLNDDAPQTATAKNLLRYYSYQKKYPLENLFDGDPATYWVEGREDDGKGVSIVITNTRAVKELKQLNIVNGCAKNKEVYRNNARVKQLDLAFANGGRKVIALKDEMAVQHADIGPIKTTSVTATITDVYPGNKFTDTCISELSFTTSDGQIWAPSVKVFVRPDYRYMIDAVSEIARKEMDREADLLDGPLAGSAAYPPYELFKGSVSRATATFSSNIPTFLFSEDGNLMINDCVWMFLPLKAIKAGAKFDTCEVAKRDKKYVQDLPMTAEPVGWSDDGKKFCVVDAPQFTEKKTAEVTTYELKDGKMLKDHSITMTAEQLRSPNRPGTSSDALYDLDKDPFYLALCPF